MKLTQKCIFYCALLLSALFAEGAIPPTIIAAIDASDMTAELIAYVSIDSNLQETDADGDSVLWLAAHNSFAFFCMQLFNVNPTGFAMIVNKPNNIGVTPLRASFSNPVREYRTQILQFLLRQGALPNV